MEPNQHTQHQSPPVILVQTWCSLLKDENEEVRVHANNMLISAFGNMKAVVDFVERHRIKV